MSLTPWQSFQLEIGTEGFIQPKLTVTVILVIPEGSGEQGKMEKTGCKLICGAPTTLAVKGLMMMMISWCYPGPGTAVPVVSSST